MIDFSNQVDMKYEKEVEKEYLKNVRRLFGGESTTKK